MLSAPQRVVLLRQTLRDLGRTDWAEPPRVYEDIDVSRPLQDRVVTAAYGLVRRALACHNDFILFLEDDLRFNRHLRCNLQFWSPLREIGPNEFFLASLYDPGVRAVEYHRHECYFIADPTSAYGSQALLLSSRTAQYILAHWHEENGFHDFRMFRLAARHCPIHYHVPSLVQHLGCANSVGGFFHCAQEFDPNWRVRQRLEMSVTEQPRGIAPVVPSSR